LKIAVLNTYAPFIRGGAEYLAESLTSKLREYGHEAALVRIPFSWEPPPKVLEGLLAARLVRIPGAQLVIGLKFPAYLVPHDNKVLWLLHQYRQAYDLWNTPFQGLPDTREGIQIRDIVRQADNLYLRQAKKIFTNSHVTSNRLMQFNGIPSEVLYPPLFDARGLECEEYGDFVFCPGRVTTSKRQYLLVEALQYCSPEVKLVIAGMEEAPEDGMLIRKLISDYGLGARVTFLNGFISEEQKAAYYRRALACAYVPYDEDSYGYVTLEAFHCKKPVLTCTDSGGIHILVKHGKTGFTAAPEPRAIAAALDAFYQDKAATARMGSASYDFIQSLHIDWDHVIAKLTQ